jgi:serine/threonine-protein kinase
MAELATGTLIDGRYKVVSRLGSGGMADVFLAEDEQLGRNIALKLLHRRFAEDPGFVERFRREAQAAAGLQHPNVVSVYDRGSFGGTYYIAMEYLPGRSLKTLIRREAPLDPIRAIDITIQILKAARFAHRHGVIHRDLKPHNVIVDDGDHAKVTDFGIARAGASDMTETGSIMGTAQYLSPEQAQGHAVSAGSDLYSIGVILYEMLTGRVPFDAEAAVTIALKHVSEAPVPPTALNPNIPPELEQVVLWALNKNPADRPADADQFVAGLEQARAAISARARGEHTTSMAALAAGGGPVAIVGVAGAMATSPASTTTPSPTALQHTDGDGASYVPTDGAAPPERKRRPRWPWLVALAVLLLAGGGAAAYLLTRPAKHVVPQVVLEQVSVAQAEIQNAGFTPNVINRTDNHPAGTVIAQDPLAGVKAKVGSTVTLTVSSGPGNVTVPSVIGLKQQDAVNTIKQNHLSIQRIQQESSDTFGAGTATRTEPVAGTTLPFGNAVTLFVSSGPPQVTVPDVTGVNESAARATLETKGFSVQSSTQPSSSANPGDVISQSPSPGTKVADGSTVSIVVASKPSTTTTTTTAPVPPVAGDTLAGATTQLTNAGYKVSSSTKDVTKQNEDGIVLSQSPAAGATANPGSTVTLVVGKYTPPHTTTTTSSRTTTRSRSSSTSSSST